MKYFGFFAIFFMMSCATVRSGKFVKLKSVGDLNDVAKRYNITVSEIRKNNKKIKDGGWIFIPRVKSSRHLSSESVLDEQVEELVISSSSHLNFEWPLENHYQITSRFGPRRGRPHHGIDIGAPHGTEILASYDGQVIFSGWMRGYGLIVVLEHEKNFKTAYAHASRVFMKKGQLVKTGDKIALVGNTGRSTGHHLHFEIRLNDEAIDPSDFFTSLKLANIGIWPYSFSDS